MGNNNTTSFELPGVRFSGPTWLAVMVLIALLVIGIIYFVGSNEEAQVTTQNEPTESIDENTPIDLSKIPEE